MDRNRSVAKKIVVSFALLGATGSSVAADQLTVGGRASMQVHSNAALTHNDQSDVVRIAGADIGYKKPDGSLTADLDYHAERRDYLHDTQGDQNSIDGKAAFGWQIQPRQLDAVLYHQISQQLINRQNANVSSNREERSIVTAGVDGYLHLSPVDSLVLSPRYADVNFQNSTQSNSQRSTVAGIWAHKLGALAALDLTAGYDHVTFDQAQSDYDSPNMMLAYHAALARLSYQAGLGYNRINRDQGDDFNGSIVRAGLDYKGEEGFSGGGIFVHQLTDSSIGLSNVGLSNQALQNNDSNFEQPSIVEMDQLDLYLDQHFSVVSSLHFGAGYLRDIYKDAGQNQNPSQSSNQDQTVAYGALGYRYSLNSFWSLGADARFEHTDFLDDPNNLNYDTTRLYVTLFYKPMRALELSLAAGQDKRDANVSANSYTDKVGIFGLQYRFY